MIPGDDLPARLIAMAREDLAKRDELVRRWELFAVGYHPEMREVHDRNARALLAVLEAGGWPRRSVVGEAAAEAAWLIVQHAIAHPDLQRRARDLMRPAVGAGEADPGSLAALEDRIRVFEGRPQLYATQFDWDEAGELSPREVEDPANVDTRRAAVGLSPLSLKTAEVRAEARREGQRPPADLAKRRVEFEAWLRETGWR